MANPFMTPFCEMTLLQNLVAVGVIYLVLVVGRLVLDFIVEKFF